MLIGSDDIRYGDDATFFLWLRVGLGGVLWRVSLGALDLAAIGLAVAVVRQLSEFAAVPASPLGGPVPTLFAYTVLLSLAATGAYRAGDDRRNVFRISGAVFVGGIALSVVARQMGWGVPWEQLVVLTGGAIVTVLEFRLLAERVRRFYRQRASRPRRVVLVGGRADLDAGQQRAAGEGMAVCGRLELRSERDAPDGQAAGLSELLSGRPADAVVVMQPLRAAEMRELVAMALERGARVEAWHAASREGDRRCIVRVDEGVVVVEYRPSYPGLPRMAIKRAMDVVLAVVGLVLISPLLAMIAAAIRLDSPGPALFGQIRVGVGGRPFRMWKFRTMVPEADRLKPALAEMNESGDPRLFKISYDPRVTRIGRWLRRTSLDELPQLINVLRGEMSLVGPRPFFPEDMELYEPHHMERLSVLPGITGLWQVSGRSDIQDFDAVVNLDREYIRRWSIGFDLRILARTIPAVIRRDGAR